MVRDSRNAAVDGLRALAMLAVISIHTLPFLRPDLLPSDQKILIHVLDQMTQVAVPAFFMLSSYFLWPQLQQDQTANVIVRKYLIRFGAATAVWQIVYIALPYQWPEAMAQYGVIRPIVWRAQAA